mmetsp:Transcript_11842/g.25957  ORF Transcript_11842/g.25957 Transcript_11842/m.25957 type:complete len:90 (+) Transcript_11842:125-394(+)
MDGCELGWDDGCDVGQSETEGFPEGWLLGGVLIDGDSDGIDVGKSVTDRSLLGFELGCDDGIDDGSPDKLGISLGCDVGQFETEGCSEG